MKIVSNIDDYHNKSGCAALTLGNFDGVHLGHRAIFRRLVDIARKEGCVSIVCTFTPHPLKVLVPEKAPLLLNTSDEKRRLIAASHVDFLAELPFTDKLSSLSPEEFVDQILVQKFQVQHLLVGYDYHFGKNRSGNAEFLKEYGMYRGIQVEVLRPVGADGRPFSSTRVRDKLLRGDVSGVIQLLGRQYNLEGRVDAGEQRGRLMGFPTANLVTDKELLPAPGVYVVKVRHNLQEYGGVVNIGTRPTFDGGHSSIEVHLLDFTGDLYGQKIRIYFIERLREERKFPDMETLADAIAEDVLAARQILITAQVVQYQEYLSLR